MRRLSQWEVYLISDRCSNLSTQLKVQSPPICSPLFPCRQETSPWVQAHAADFHTLVYTRVRLPKMTDTQLVSRLDEPRGQWTGCPLLHRPFLEAHRLVSEQTPGRGQVEMAISLYSSSFLVFPVSPPFTSPSVLTHYIPIPFILKSYLCLYKLLSLVSLLYVVLSV